MNWIKNFNMKIQKFNTISRESPLSIDIHLISDVNINGVCRVVHAIIYQSNNVSHYVSIFAIQS